MSGAHIRCRGHRPTTFFDLMCGSAHQQTHASNVTTCPPPTRACAQRDDTSYSTCFCEQRDVFVKATCIDPMIRKALAWQVRANTREGRGGCVHTHERECMCVKHMCVSVCHAHGCVCVMLVCVCVMLMGVCVCVMLMSVCVCHAHGCVCVMLMGVCVCHARVCVCHAHGCVCHARVCVCACVSCSCSWVCVMLMLMGVCVSCSWVCVWMCPLPSSAAAGPPPSAS